MKKFEIDGSVLRIPTSFIKRLLKYRKRYRYMIEYFGNCETFEVWTKRLFGIEFIYSRKKSARRLAYDPIPKDLFSKESLSAERIIEAFKGCSLPLMNSEPEGLFLAPSIFAEGVEGPLIHCDDQSQNDQGVTLEFTLKDPLSASDAKSITDKCSEIKGPIPTISFDIFNPTETSNIVWIGDKWFNESKLLKTDYCEWFFEFFLTEKGSLIRKSIFNSFCDNNKEIVKYQIASAEEVYEYELWMANKEGWATKIDPNPNNAL